MDYDGEFIAAGGFDQKISIDLRRGAVIVQTEAGERNGGISALEQAKIFRATITTSSNYTRH